MSGFSCTGCCGFIFQKKAWREEELVRIQARLKELQDWESPAPLMLAGIHLNFLLEMMRQNFEVGPTL